MVEKCFKVKGRKQTKIKNCSLSNIKKLNKKGYSVSKVTTIGTKTTIQTFSPKTRKQALKEHRKRLGKIPF